MQVSEAVSYLRSAGHWSIALWLARYNACFFSSSELYLQGSDCLRKTSTHSLPSIVISSPTKVTLKSNPGLFADLTQILGRVKEACKTHLLSGRNQAAIETLHLAQVHYLKSHSSVLLLLNFQERGLAVRLLPLLEQACGQVSDNSGEQVDGKGDSQGVEELAEEQARLIGCLREAVIMEAARSCL